MQKKKMRKMKKVSKKTAPKRKPRTASYGKAEMPSLKMLATALKMEEKGKNFYEKALLSCKNDLGRGIFTFLMNEEIVHVGRIKNIFENIKSGRGWSDEWKSIKARPVDIGHIFHEMAEQYAAHIKADTGDLDALNIGLDFEQKAVNFYASEMPKAKEAMEKDFIEMMILEEKKHVEILENMKQYVTDPEGWNAHLDGLRYDG